MSLFELKLNEEGIRAIRGFEKLAKWSLALTIVITAILLLESWASFFWSLKAEYFGNKYVRVQVRVFPFIMMIYAVMVYFQAHYYLKTGKQLNAAVEENDEIAFNQSFILLLRNSFFGLIGLSLAFIMIVFRIFAQLMPYDF